MNILLDENFPLALYHQLQKLGFTVEHIIVLGQRGLSDASIRKRLLLENLLFLTHDTESLDSASLFKALVIISRVRQSRPIHERVKIWINAVQNFQPTPYERTCLNFLIAVKLSRRKFIDIHMEIWIASFLKKNEMT